MNNSIHLFVLYRILTLASDNGNGNEALSNEQCEPELFGVIELLQRISVQQKPAAKYGMVEHVMQYNINLFKFTNNHLLICYG